MVFYATSILPLPPVPRPLVGFSVKRFAHSETLFACFYSLWTAAATQHESFPHRAGHRSRSAAHRKGVLQPAKDSRSPECGDCGITPWNASRLGSPAPANRASTLGYYLKLIRCEHRKSRRNTTLQRPGPQAHASKGGGVAGLDDGHTRAAGRNCPRPLRRQSGRRHVVALAKWLIEDSENRHGQPVAWRRAAEGGQAAGEIRDR